jgi:hypothetical protein
MLDVHRAARMLALGCMTCGLATLACSGSSPLQEPPDGGAADAAAVDASGPDEAADLVLDAGSPVDRAALCEGIASEYADSVLAAQACTVGAAGQCQVSVRAGFFCNCTTFVNGGADGLAAIAAHYMASGCTSFCNGTCVQVQSLSCLADTSSPTGGRCKLANTANLTAANQGGSATVKVGDEIDITLGSVGPGSYSQDPVLSNDNLTVIEVTFPAGQQNPGGPTLLYRLRALAPGQTQVEIPFNSAPAGGAGQQTFTVTITVM